MPTIPGLKYQQIPPDGSCLYHAVAVYLGKSSQDLREEVATMLAENKDHYQDFFATSTNDQTIDEYIEAIQRENEFATEIEIDILMHLFDRDIVIIGPDGLIRNQGSINRFTGPPIFVYYNNIDHYDGF